MLKFIGFCWYFTISYQYQSTEEFHILALLTILVLLEGNPEASGNHY